jgi:uncharacterized protein YbjT (DUF2867 family)
MSNVLIVGGTGVVGSQICEMLLKRGDYAHLLVRDNEQSLAKAKPLIMMGAQIIKGDLTDPSSLRNAANTMDQIVATAATFDDSFTEGYRALLASAQRAHVNHFIYISNWPRIQPLLSTFVGKHLAEQLVIGSGINYTILQAEPFLGYVVNFMIKMAVDAGYPVGLFAKNDEVAKQGKHYWISETDVATLTVTMLGNLRAFDKIYHVGGPEALSFAGVVERYALINKANAPVVTLSEPPNGVPDFIYRLVGQLFEYDSPKPDDVGSQFGVKMTHPDTIIRQKQ